MAGLFVLALSTTAGCGDDGGEGGSDGSGGAGGIGVTGSGTGGSDATSTCSSGGAAPTGTGGAEPTGTGGAAPTGTGGAEPTGTGGAEPTGTGGAEPTGTGGAAPTGTGGAEPTGTGGAEPTGTGGAEPTGTGGAAPTGTGGAEPTGSGGAAPTGTGGAEPTGTGGAAPTGSGGAEPTGSGGAEPTGTGGAEPTGSGGAEPTGTGGAEPTGSGGAGPTGTGGAEPTGSGGAEPTGGSGGAPPAGGSGGAAPAGGSGGADPTGGSGGAAPTGAGGADPTAGSGGSGGGTSSIYGAACSDHEACPGEYCLTEAEGGGPSGSCSGLCDPAVGGCSEGGVCVDFGEGHGLCILRCSSSDECRDGYTCSDIGDGVTACTPACTTNAQCTQLGVCDPSDGFCKMGELECTDGVDNEGDGRTDCSDNDCNATCAPLASAACAGAAPMTTTTVAGDTSRGTSLFEASCTGHGPEQLHVFTPPAGQSGTLLVVLQSESDHGLYSRSACTDSLTEIACIDESAASSTLLEEEELELVVHRGEVVPIFVDAYTPFDAGPYTLDFVFVPAICGDGAVSKPEECDDGNTAGGDGCSAECTLELDDACAAALPAVLGDNRGNTSSGTTLFDGSCVSRGMPERIHAFTPPSDGRLIVTLSSETDLGLYARTSCADKDSQLACADSYSGGRNETLSLDVDGGAPLFIFVDTYRTTDAGPYTLNLAFTPAP
ncbi:DUF4215 domain-containing protein [Sorangium sp. So ce1335]|uniref:DUF4215 domain-containing protein n=1 Tax=Sorangium sp. So ce1335 TaxID=3133335 RepID=UPI003F5F526A